MEVIINIDRSSFKRVLEEKTGLDNSKQEKGHWRWQVLTTHSRYFTVKEDEKRGRAWSWMLSQESWFVARFTVTFFVCLLLFCFGCSVLCLETFLLCFSEKIVYSFPIPFLCPDGEYAYIVDLEDGIHASILKTFLYGRKHFLTPMWRESH